MLQALSSDLRDLLSRCLDQDPFQRIGIAGVVAHPWVVAGGAAQEGASDNDSGAAGDAGGSGAGCKEGARARGAGTGGAQASGQPTTPPLCTA